MDRWAKGSHGGVFNGNAVSCAAAVATIDAILEEDMLANCERQGERFRAFLRELQAKYPVVGDVRGLGLMNVIEFVKPASDNQPDGEAQKRFLPPININDEDMAAAMEIISAAASEAFAD
jgi:4-aminobutyrate aminotransferase